MKSNRYYVLNDRKGKEVIRGLRADVPPIEEDEDKQGDDMEESDMEDEDEGLRVSRGARGMTGSGAMLFEDDLMEAVIRSSRPEEHQS